MRERGHNQYKNGFCTSLSALLTICLLHRGCARFRTFVLQRGSLPFLFRCHAIKKLAWQTQRLAKPKFFLRKNGGWSIGDSNP